MTNLREKLETLCTELATVQKTLKKAGKSRKKQSLADVRRLISETASTLEQSLASIEPERLCRPGVSKQKYDEMIATSCCYKCGSKRGVVVQWLSPNTGRALRRFSIVCENCWNLTIRERTINGVIEENNNINRTFQK